MEPVCDFCGMTDKLRCRSIETAEGCPYFSREEYFAEDMGVVATPKKPHALSAQVGGNHYRKLVIQPMTYSMANGLDACQHTIIKYVTRFRDKGGIADLEKAKHTIDLLIHFEQEKTNAGSK